ncbi:MAG: hypothetical protein JWM45_3019 [Pseudonocardiales bacterium]|jgi:hypothetical protein|nr:hypothetical protein [Pseudonocardiales bacterium]
MGDNVDARLELIGRIEARRASIDAFVRRVRPRNVRLTNTSIINELLTCQGRRVAPPI